MSAMKPLCSRMTRLLAYAALGPITGPLAAGVVRNLRGGAPGLAGLYVLAWIAIYFDLLAFMAQTSRQALG